MPGGEGARPIGGNTIMPLLDAERSRLIIIDAQTKLMPAIDRGQDVLRNAGRLVAASRLVDVPVLTTEQYPAGLGPTVPELAGSGPVVEKTSFDSCAAPAFLDALAGDQQLIVIGCEAHVCVCQTVLSLLSYKRRVFVVQDAVGSRAAQSKEVALRRMERHGAEIVTTEMVVFEWLRNARHPRFREASRLIK